MARSKKPSTAKPRSTRKKNKKTKFPPAIIIGGVFFLIVATIIILIMNIKVNTLKKQSKTTVKASVESITTDMIDNRIQQILSTQGHHIDVISSKDMNEYGDQFDMTYTISIQKQKQSDFKNQLIRSMRKYKFMVSDSGNKLSFKKSGQNLNILFKIPEKKPVVVVKPPKQESKRPKISIILDDAGRDLKTLKKMLKDPHPITIATIPYTRHDIETVKLIRAAGKTAFLHLPCEPKSYPKTNPGKGAIYLNTPPELIDITLQKMFTRLNVDGFNNHMGSALTENKKKMMQVLKAAKYYTDIYVDSRTTPDTVAFEVCQSVGMQCGMNRKFIDNEKDPEYIKGRLKHSVEYAKKHGEAIIIGHLKPNTVSVLINYLPTMKKNGIDIVPLKQVLH